MNESSSPSQADDRRPVGNRVDAGAEAVERANDEPFGRKQRSPTPHRQTTVGSDCWVFHDST